MDFNALRKIVSPAAIGMSWTEAQTLADPYLGEVLFPRQQKAGLELSWFKGSKGLPVSLMPSAFDAKATYRDRPGVNKLESEMPFFREGFKIKEKDRQNILNAMDTNNPYVREIIGKVFDDANELLEGARVVGERERMQLLFPKNGNLGISIVANGVDYTYNYDINGSWRESNYFALTGQGVWTDKDHSDPFADIQTGKDAISDKGGKAAMMIMNSATFRNLRGNKAVLNKFITTSGIAVATPGDGDITKVLRDTTELDIVIYDKKYQNENKNTFKFCPDGYVAIVPDGTLGTTYLGTTPEEADLLSSNMADVAIVDSGVAVTQIVEPHPVNINTIVSEIILPSYEQMDQVAVLKVY
ncbi:MAG TPA: phage capsid protein [Lachnospiraceae bacterium]|nr:phage capsid protein [Lachnospiraceae bacterium]